MSRKNNLVFGTLLSTTSIIITKFIGLIYVIPFYKIVGEYGGILYSYAYNIYTIFLNVASVGIPKSISKIICEYDTKKKYNEKKEVYYLSIEIIGIISIISFLLMFIYAPLIASKLSSHKEDVTFVIRCISTSILIIPTLSVTKGYFEGHKLMLYPSIANIIEQLIRVLVIVIGSFISYKILNQSVALSVGISLFGALVGGLFANKYISKYISKNESILKLNIKSNKRVNKKIIVKKIIKYSIPFIFISLSHSIYNFTDMFLTVKGLKIIKYNNIDYIVTALTTWAPKICSIISSLSIGLIANLIPCLTVLYTEKKWGKIEERLNKTYKLLLFISIPLALNIFLSSNEIWTLFYNENILGSKILKFQVISTFFLSFYTVTLNSMQILNKYKIVYKSVIYGLFVNAIFDIPLIIIFKLLNIDPYYGPIVSSIIGYMISIFISLNELHTKNHFRFNSTLKSLILILLLSLISVLPYKIININTHNKLLIIILVFIKFILSGIIYLSLSYKLLLRKKKLTSGKL